MNLLQASITDDNDAILLSFGDDTVEGLLGNDTIIAGPGDDVIHGDRVDGPFPSETGAFPVPPGNNLISGGSGDDQVFGGFGADTVFGGSGDDVLSGAGFTRLVGRNETTGAGPYFTQGADAGDVIGGGSGDDRVEGWAGRDTLSGGSGQDTIVGGAGADLLFGGSGADAFAFGWTPREGTSPAGILGRLWFDSGLESGNRDVVTDFNRGSGDTLDFGRYLTYAFANPTYAGPGEVLADGRAVFLGRDAELGDVQTGSGGAFKTFLSYTHEQGNTIVRFTAHIFPEASDQVVPRGAWQGEIELVGTHDLTARDFTFDSVL